MKFLGVSFFTVLLCLVLVSCKKSRKNVIQENVTMFIKKNMEKGDDYEAVSFGKVDTVYEKLKESKKFHRFKDKIIRLEADSTRDQIMMRIVDNAEEKQQHRKELQETMQKLKDTRKAFKRFKNNFEPDISHLEVRHQFKENQKNKEKVFVIDTNLNVLKSKSFKIE